MKLALPLACALALLLLAGCGGSKTVTKTVTVNPTAKSGAGSPREVVEFGYVKSLKPKGSGYEMRFDPAWLLTGKTANQAAWRTRGRVTFRTTATWSTSPRGLISSSFRRTRRSAS